MRFDTPEGKIELPVKLRVHDSIFVPLAKWSMLLAGNYRCVTKDGMRTAQEAVHSDLEASRAVYNFVFDLCVKLGAKPADLVPFEKYAAAARKPHASGLGGARPAERRAQHRAGRQAGAVDRQAERHEPPRDRRPGGAGRRAARRQPQEGGRGLRRRTLAAQPRTWPLKPAPGFAVGRLSPSPAYPARRQDGAARNWPRAG